MILSIVAHYHCWQLIPALSGKLSLNDHIMQKITGISLLSYSFWAAVTKILQIE